MLKMEWQTHGVSSIEIFDLKRNTHITLFKSGKTKIGLSLTWHGMAWHDMVWRETVVL